MITISLAAIARSARGALKMLSVSTNVIRYHYTEANAEAPISRQSSCSPGSFLACTVVYHFICAGAAAAADYTVFEFSSRQYGNPGHVLAL